MPMHTVNVSPSQLLRGDNDSAVNPSSTSPFPGVGLPRKLETGPCNLLTPAPIPKLTGKMSRGACFIRQRMLSAKGKLKANEVQKVTPLHWEEDEVRKIDDGGKEINHRNELSAVEAAPNRADTATFISNREATPPPVPWPVHIPGPNPRGSLRQFSLQVADELVKLYVMSVLQCGIECGVVQNDEKNIRRRVYDALNVLSAMKIIEKSKKTIIWKGMPTAITSDYSALKSPAVLEARARVKAKRRAVETKTKELQSLVKEHLALKKLAQRNSRKDNLFAGTQQGTSLGSSQRVKLPLVVLRAPGDTVVQCLMNSTQDKVSLTMDKPFDCDRKAANPLMWNSYTSDAELFEGMGLARCYLQELPGLLAHELHDFVPTETIIHV